MKKLPTVSQLVQAGIPFTFDGCVARMEPSDSKATTNRLVQKLAQIGCDQFDRLGVGNSIISFQFEGVFYRLQAE